MRMTLILAALGLGACTTAPAMESALAPLTGQPVQLVFDQLGPPSTSTPAGADTVYDWHRARPVSGTPASGSLVAPVAEGENTMTSGFYPGPPVAYSCDVRIVADGYGRIKDWQFGEQTGGCRESARSLRQVADAR